MASLVHNEPELAEATIERLAGVLQYTITGQISDYFTYGGVAVADVLGDGQTFDGSYVPTLTVDERGVTAATVPLPTFFTDTYIVRCSPFWTLPSPLPLRESAI